MINKFSSLNEVQYFSSEIFIEYLYQLKNALNILVALLGLIRGKLMGEYIRIISEEYIENITKSNNFIQTFVDHYLLQEIIFNGCCLIKKIVFLFLKN